MVMGGKIKSAIMLISAIVIVSCGQTEQDFGTQSEIRGPWGNSDAPGLMGKGYGITMKTNINDLPESGEAEQIPWAGYYWSTYKDSINNRWERYASDPKSPAEKYAQAFGKKGVDDIVSLDYGTDSRISTGSKCTTDSECTGSNQKCYIRTITNDEGNDEKEGFCSEKVCSNNSECDDASSCSKRIGESMGLCIPTWFGICHAWAPVAVEEPEPVNAVTHNGVTFKVNDIKALVTYGYNNGLTTDFMSLRCDEDEAKITYDENGSPVSERCKDTNAGSFHIVATNLLGIHKKAYVEDRTWDDEVWNQPVRGYNIKMNQEVDAKTANELIGLKDKEEYAFNAQAAKFRHIKMDFFYIGESYDYQDGNFSSTIDRYTFTDVYEYILELDAADNIIGGEWVGNSKKLHPDFLWYSYNKENLSVSGILWSDIKMLLNKSVGKDADNAEYNSRTKIHFSKNVKKNEFEKFTPVTAEAGKVEIIMSGSGDADLFVKKDGEVSQYSYTCRPYKDGSVEKCEFEGPGTFYIAASGYAPSSKIVIDVIYNNEKL